MRSLTLKEIASPGKEMRSLWTGREASIIAECARTAVTGLCRVLAKEDIQAALQSAPEYPSDENPAGVSLNFSLRSMKFSVVLPEILCIYLIDEYLKREPTIVTQELNREELIIIGLLAALLIAELREQGIWGLSLEGVHPLTESSSGPREGAVALRSVRFNCVVGISLDRQLVSVIRDRAKLLRQDAAVTRLIGRSEVQAELSTEIRGICIQELSRLGPRSRLFLGRTLPSTISVQGTAAGNTVLGVGRHGKLQSLSGEASVSGAAAGRSAAWEHSDLRRTAA